MFLYALTLGVALVAGGFGVVGLEPWWQRALAYYGVGIPVFFAWIFGVFGFVGRAKLMLAAEGRGADDIMAWGERWFLISIAVLGVVALAGVVALFRMDGWVDRLRVFFLVGPSVLMGGMGLVFCFCAVPQMRAPSEAGESEGGPEL